MAIEFAPMFLRLLKVGAREPHPLVLTVRRRTVAKVDSIGLVVRRLRPSSLTRSASEIISSLFIAGVSFRVLVAGMCRTTGFVFTTP
jgi:hypothetical protein